MDEAAAATAAEGGTANYDCAVTESAKQKQQQHLRMWGSANYKSACVTGRGKDRGRYSSDSSRGGYSSSGRHTGGRAPASRRSYAGQQYEGVVMGLMAGVATAGTHNSSLWVYE